MSRGWRAAGWATVLVGCLRPVGNHDLFWHLSAGRQVFQTGAPPRSDFLSFTRAGAAWVDFEWLTQAAYALFQGLAGWPGLIALKTLLLAGTALLVERAQRRAGVEAPARAAWLAVLAATWALANDARPENVSLLLLAWLLAALEAGGPGPAAAALVFALWGNTHAGFALGLAALASYAGEALWRRDGARARALLLALAAASAAVLLNPFGWRVYAVVLEHAAEGARLSRSILEWGWATPRNAYHWPFWLLAAAVAGALARLRPAAALFLLALGAGAAFHRRGIPAFAVASAVLAGPALAAGLDRRRCAALAAAGALFVLLLRPAGGLGLERGAFPERTAAFLGRETALWPLRAYNPWGWGGYLAWRLGQPVFFDGRYIFHDLLFEEMRATARPESWQAFLDAHRLDAAVLRRDLPPVPVKRPDGSFEPRPYYLFFMPQDRWALVFWDDVSLLFVRRSAAPAAWLAAHEYRVLHPDDGAALGRALEKGAIERKDLESETWRLKSEGGG